VNVFDQAGLFTDADGRSATMTPQRFHDLGYRWIVAQAQNGAAVKPVDLGAYRALEFAIGPWGVSYEQENLARDARALLAAATSMRADVLVWDLEQVLKGCPREVLEEALGILDAFPGVKAVSVLGASSDGSPFPIAIDVFLAHGWDVLAQAYVAWATCYNPVNCVAQWVGAHDVPVERFHLTLDSSSESRAVADGGMGRAATPEELLALLRDTRITSPDVSVFMAEYGDDHFYTTIAEVTMQQTPQDAASTKAAVYALVDAQVARWRANGLSETKIAAQRITVAEQLLKTTDAEWTVARPKIQAALA
jgi:hypothetical protein